MLLLLRMMMIIIINTREGFLGVKQQYTLEFEVLSQPVALRVSLQSTATV
jgi:hypothetical protein